MSNIKYITGNILNISNYPRIIIHSCNCGGSWGGGIARQLGNRYPKAEQAYVNACEKYGNKLLGKCLFIPSYKDANVIICCLFTAEIGGSNYDLRASILKYTEQALNNVRKWIYGDEGGKSDPIETGINSATQHNTLKDYKLEMPKINSGIFGIPWQETENILRKFGNGNKILSFTVYSL
ncbi:POA1 (YBR022W) [Zygosaccharomyces parabailii]|nr:POA1 (YBR022W) [Zygosaccharomyces parabailii]CDH10273.1 related to ADP-ribose 1''-phosphate phosphatase [Zygosaccharomyces bailii ISA1307]